MESKATQIRSAVTGVVAKIRGIQPKQVTDDMTIVRVDEFCDEMGPVCFDLNLPLLITGKDMKVREVIDQMTSRI